MPVEWLITAVSFIYQLEGGDTAEMNGRERILSIKLIEKEKAHPDFVSTIGIKTSMTVNSNEENNDKKGEPYYVMEAAD